jgi:predicted outer membrane repeat protein
LYFSHNRDDIDPGFGLKEEDNMYRKKIFPVLIISVLLMGVLVSPSTAVERKIDPKTIGDMQLNATYTVCANGCDFSSIQTAIDSVNAGDTLSLAAETFTESIIIEKSLNLIGAGAENTIVQAATTPEDATSRVIKINGDVNVTIQDITIRYGYSPPTYWMFPIPTNGGGIFNEGGAITLLNTNLFDNTASGNGGGIFMDTGEMTVSNSIISGNIAEDGGGGGIYNLNCDTNLTDVIFQENSSDAGGGGIYNNNGSPILTNVTLIDNTSGYRGGGMYNQYGDNTILENVIFSGNIANGHGGGMHNAQSTSELSNVTFTNNSSDSGGGMSNYGSTATLVDVRFIGNTVNMVQNFGGGMDNYQSTVKITNGIFHNNSADYGGGIRMYDGSSEISNVSFSNNSAIYSGGGLHVTAAGPALRNLSFSNNDADIGGGIFMYVGNSIIQDSGGSGTGWDSSLGIDGGGNIDQDPLFVDSPNDDLHLSYGSPAIDTGKISVCPPTDLDGVLRPQGADCDMGAFEFGFVNVDIDIKPGSDPNSINCTAVDKIITIAILTTAEFDATTVDHTTVTFEGASEIHVNKKTGEPHLHVKDVDFDGDLDLVFHFRLGDTALTCDSAVGALTGETYDGIPIEGTDSVRMINQESD